MKDGLDVVTDVWAMLNQPSVVALLGAGGQIWKHDKPGGRGLTKTDIVVNSLGITNSQQQRGVANVNIYVPNLLVTQDDGTKQQVPNVTKLNTICKAITPLLDTRWMPTFHTDIEDPGTLLQDTDGSWFISIQLNYYSIQNNYQNI